MKLPESTFSWSEEPRRRLVALLWISLVCWTSVAALAEWTLRSTPGTGADVWIFDALPHDGPAPVVVFLHGSGSSADAWRPFLEGPAEEAGVVVVAPQALSAIGFGVGADDETIAEALGLVRTSRPIEEDRIAIAGHSAGAAYALSLAYGTTSRFSAVFALASPYRQLLEVADPDYSAAARLYYGTEDPNYASSYPAWVAVLDRLAIPWEEEVAAGFGHSGFPETTLEDGFVFLSQKRYGDPGPCRADRSTLCLHQGKFRARVSWADFASRSGVASVVDGHRSDSGLFWFFRRDNWELMVKVLDGCARNDRYWVFTSATTNVSYSIEIEDLTTGAIWSYSNPLGELSPAHADINAFTSCP